MKCMDDEKNDHDSWMIIQEEEESDEGAEGERKTFDAKPLLENWGQFCLGQVGVIVGLISKPE